MPIPGVVEEVKTFDPQVIIAQFAPVTREVIENAKSLEVIGCLRMGRQSPGGHILHNSHSVHEDVKIENYYAVVQAYRDFFGMERLPQ